MERGIEGILKNLSQEEIIKITEKYGAHNYKPLKVVITKGKGAYVWDKEGNKYLDCIGCYSAVSHGHLNKNIINSAIKQMKKLTLTGRPVYTEELAIFFKVLSEYTKMDMVLPMNTGAEAVETAIKAARRWGYFKKKVEEDKAEIIACEKNFHGRTVTIVGFSTEEGYRKGFGPFTPGFKIIPYADPDALKKAITKNTVAFLVEPIQAEGGVIIPYDGYLKDIRKICDEENILLIFDEIQTGFGRTGKRFAWEWENAKPDLITLGKALGGGIFPVSAVAGKKEVMEVFDPGSHGSTFGGNPLGVRIAIEAILEMERLKLHENSRKMGEKLLKGLKEIKSDIIKEVRGKGLLIGVEIKEEAGEGMKYAEMLLKEGIITKDTHKYTLRITPPLIIGEKEVDLILKAFKKVFEK
uniref:ornithine aminotransferase n=1 Tax=candidate division WOR-3 bacterium TaxID=2052148 RepID=A0A7V4ED41_UNCW3